MLSSILATIDVTEHEIYLVSGISVIAYVASASLGVIVSIKVWKFVRRAI